MQCTDRFFRSRNYRGEYSFRVEGVGWKTPRPKLDSKSVSHLREPRKNASNGNHPQTAIYRDR